MSNIYNTISVLANLISIVLALIGLYFVHKNWCIWKKKRIEILKAKAFLNKEFLEINWLYMVIAGGLIMVRRIYRFFELTFEFKGHPEIEVIFDLIGCAVILVLVLMAYQWHKLVHTHFVYKES